MTTGPKLVLATCAAGLVSLFAAGPAGATFPGTNGKIAFSYKNSSDPAQIFTMDPSGQNRTALTNGPDQDFDPSWSGDGEMIAFARAPVAPPQLGDIWVMKHDGTGQTQVTNPPAPNSDFEPAFSPDGTKIAFSRYNGSTNQIYIVNANGSGETQLTFPATGSAAAADFSPNGQKIAFARRDSATGFQSIATMNIDGSNVQDVTPGSATIDDYAPDWSPNGAKIVFERDFTSSSSIRTVNADGSGESQVTEAPNYDLSPVYSPDGVRVAFEREPTTGPFPTNIFLADSTGLNQNITPLSDHPAGTHDYTPDWQALNPPSCDLSGKATTKSVKQVSLTVTCTNENATVVAEGSGKAPKVPKSGAVASKAKKFTIAPVTVQVQQGTSTAIKLKIPKKGQKALKKTAKAGKTGKATITATTTDDFGLSSTETFKVKFKAKKKKK